jgi:hypothetical protein
MTDDPRDETQAIPPADEPTRMMPPVDDPTRRMDVPPGGGSDPTRRIDVTPPAVPAATQRMQPNATTPRASGPATERLAVPAAGRGIAAWMIAAVVIVSLIAGGLAGYTQRDPSDSNVVARALVGPGGGVMTFDGKGKLTVPSGALPSPTAITVRRETIDQRVRLGAEGDASSVTYEPGELVVYAFEPADLRFQQPVTIELPRSGDASAVFVDTRGSPRVMQGKVSDDRVKIETSSFSFDDAAGAG